MRLECSICASQSAPEDAADKGWVAMASCGHMYHRACIEKWQPKGGATDESRCIYRCKSRDVKWKVPGRYNKRQSLEFIPLFLPNGAAPSSDALEESQSQFEAVARRLSRGNQPAAPEEEEEEIEDADEPAQDGGSEVEQLRAALREARNEVRDQRQRHETERAELEQFRLQAQHLEQQVDQLGDRNAALQEQLNDRDEEDDFVAELEQQVANHDFEMATLEARYNHLKQKHNNLDSDFREAKIKWSEETRRLKEQLGVAGESGQDKIRELEQVIEEKDRELMHQQAKVDLAEKAQDDAAKLLEKARAATQKTVSEMDRQSKHFETKQNELKVQIKGLQGAALLAKKKIDRLKKQLGTKKGVVAGDDDDEDGDVPADLPNKTSRPFARTTSSRSRTSPSPGFFLDDDDPAPLFKVNNNSALLSPKKHARTKSVMDHDAYDISAGSLDADNKPTMDELDDDSDLEIVEPSDFKGKGRAASNSLRPLSSRPSLTNAFPSSSLSAFSSSAPVRGEKRSADAFLPSLFSSSATSANAFGPSKKPTLEKHRSDAYLPRLSEGLTSVGQKNKPKIGKKR
ncbi:hypothetical protein JCM10207_004904 [Rhodosporidiobolus poonsookiae]